MLVRDEGDSAGAVQLDERGDGRGVLRVRILGRRAGERGRGVVLDIDDVGHGAVVRDERELLLDAFRLEEGSSLTVGCRERRTAVGLRLGLEERDCADGVNTEDGGELTEWNSLQ